MQQQTNTQWRAACLRAELDPHHLVAVEVQDQCLALLYIPELADGVFALALDEAEPAPLLDRSRVEARDGDLIADLVGLSGHFDMRTGRCIESEQRSLTPWPAKIEGDRVWVGAASC